MQNFFKNKVAALIMFSVFASCSLFTESELDEPFNVPPDNIVVVSASLDNESFATIILFDVNDPSIYKVIPNGNNFLHIDPIDLKFSNKKQNLIFSSIVGVFDAPPLLYLLDIESFSFEAIYRAFLDYEDPNAGFNYLHGTNIVWFLEDDGFYVHGTNIPWSPGGDGFYSLGMAFDLVNKVEVPLKFESFSQENVLAVIGDSLLVSGTHQSFSNAEKGIYFTDPTGNYISKIPNPHLRDKSTNEISIPDWHSGNKLLVYAELEESETRRRIIVSDLDGNVFNVYTDATFDDVRPVWGSNGEYIIFKRNLSANYGKLMILNLSSGEIKDLATPNDFNAKRIYIFDH